MSSAVVTVKILQISFKGGGQSLTYRIGGWSLTYRIDDLGWGKKELENIVFSVEAAIDRAVTSKY